MQSVGKQVTAVLEPHRNTNLKQDQESRHAVERRYYTVLTLDLLLTPQLVQPHTPPSVFWSFLPPSYVLSLLRDHRALFSGGWCPLLLFDCHLSFFSVFKTLYNKNI